MYVCTSIKILTILVINALIVKQTCEMVWYRKLMF